MFDLRRLQALHAVSQHGTLGEAARSLNFTPSAISQQLTALEREAGCELLARKGRGVELTESGRLLAAHAATVLDQLAAARSALDRDQGTTAGTVRVAAFPTAVSTVIAAAVAEAAATLPDVRVQVTEAEPGTALRLLETGAVDLAAVHSYDLAPRELPRRVTVAHLFDDEMLVALPPDHRIATGDRKVRLADLRHDRWVTPGSSTSCFEYVQRACGEAGFVPDVVATCTDYAASLALVAAGAGVALVPERALTGPAASGAASVVAVRRVTPRHHRHVHLAGLPSASTATSAVADLLVTTGASASQLSRIG